MSETVEPGPGAGSGGADMPCGHDLVTTSGLMAGPGGEMHEVGLCAGCGHMLRRFSPLEAWSSAEENA